MPGKGDGETEKEMCPCDVCLRGGTAPVFIDFSIFLYAHPCNVIVMEQVNTLDEFKECNKTEFLRSSGLKILAAIDSGEAVADPSILSSFSMLVYSDLKAYAHYYWFNFPALSLLSAAKLKKDPTPLSRAFSQEQVSKTRCTHACFSKNLTNATNVTLQVRRLHEGYEGLSGANEAGPSSSSSSSKGFFIVLVNKSTAELSVIIPIPQVSFKDFACGIDSSPHC